MLTEFEVGPIKSLGGVCESTVPGNLNKLTQNSKMQTFRWVYNIAPKDFFVDLGMIQMHTKFRTSK